VLPDAAPGRIPVL